MFNIWWNQQYIWQCFWLHTCMHTCLHMDCIHACTCNHMPTHPDHPFHHVLPAGDWERGECVGMSSHHHRATQTLQATLQWWGTLPGVTFDPWSNLWPCICQLNPFLSDHSVPTVCEEDLCWPSQHDGDSVWVWSKRWHGGSSCQGIISQFISIVGQKKNSIIWVGLILALWCSISCLIIFYRIHDSVCMHVCTYVHDFSLQVLPKAATSLKVFAELPIIVVLLYQVQMYNYVYRHTSSIAHDFRIKLIIEPYSLQLYRQTSTPPYLMPTPCSCTSRQCTT